MRRMGMILWVVLIALIVVAGYIRLAPADPMDWHVAPTGDTDADFRGGAFRVISAGPEALQQFDRIARETPRTRVLAGAVDSDMITYVTRSAVWGFPDYTTAQQDGEVLRIHARLRFGRSDFGVNRQRVEGWVARLQP